MSAVTNLFNKVFKSANEQDTTKRGLMAGSLWGAPISIGTLSSTSITDDGSMSIVSFYECVKEISEAIATMPRHIYHYASGQKEITQDHDQVRYWTARLNPFVSNFKIIRTWIDHYLERGNGYLTIQREAGRPVRYDNNKNIIPFLDINKTLYYYDYIDNIVYDHYDVLHLADLSDNEYLGKSKVLQHALTLGRSKAADDLANKVFTNGSFLGAVVEYPEAVDSLGENSEQLREHIRSFRGVDKGGDTLVLTRGGKYNQLKIDMPLSDAEYIANANMTEDQIRAIFNMPSKSNNTYNGIEQKKIHILQNVLLPIITQMEEEINYKIFRPKELGRYQVKHNFKGYLRADSKAQAEYLSKLVPTGLLTINEGREYLDKPPVPGGDVPMFAANNMLPLSMADEFGQAMIKKMLQGTTSTSSNNNTDGNE